MTALAESIARPLVAMLGADAGKRAFDNVIVRYGIPDRAEVALSLALREHWRLQHGNTDSWDAAARASGFEPTLYERRP